MFDQQRPFPGGGTTIEIPPSSPLLGPCSDSPQMLKGSFGAQQPPQPLSTPCRLLSFDLLKSLELESPTYCAPEEGASHPFASLATTASTIGATPLISLRTERTELETPQATDDDDVGASPSFAGGASEVDACGGSNSEDDKNSWTTVMLKNIPNKYDDAMLADEIWRRGLGDAYSYIYAVPDPRTGLNRGYAFIDLKSHELACEFMERFEGVQLPSRKSSKVCACMWANKQGARTPADVGASVGGGLTASGQAWLSPSEALHNKHNAFAVPVYSSPALKGRRSCKWLDSGSPSFGFSPTSTLNNETGFSNRYKMFVGGLGPHTTSEDLHEYFSKFGVVEDCVVVTCKATGASRGFGFCQMQSEEGFYAAFSEQPHVVGDRTIGIRRYDYSIVPSPTNSPTSTSSRSRLSAM
ncbi:hypothetical protein FOZ61_005306 [Perkinsus olseni]|uniref:RRM domain-containing protein n=1 Tax=Perkinsus olseni TaxID=32597 RepID=A0A7J6LIL2_PEROL|nr:hypothetical protein FOZ61_005306 [Perkinsus olseni]KAF4667545.1 hypothetical protein FOL46_002440 [Perkinsus olseni]